MLLVLHGAAGGWDELLIALVGVAVLWIAVKLAGRKSAGDDDDEREVANKASVELEGEHTDPVQPPAARPG
jgi:hypothetical protein